MIHSKFIGEKISSRRKKLNFSQAELAEKLFISPQAIGKWERGESLPDITTLNRLTEIFCVDLNYFSENFSLKEVAEPKESLETSNASTKKQSWDLSKQNLVDLDLSGIENLKEQLNAANIQNCLFVGSNLQGISLKSNNISNCDFSNSNLSNNSFESCKLNNSELLKSYFTNCNFSETDFSVTTFQSSYFTNCKLQNAKLKKSKFLEAGFQELVFNGTIENCSFENCSFSGVKFENAILINTFFKNNRKLKTVQFIGCQMDKLTYAFLKNNQANLKDVVII